MIEPLLFLGSIIMGLIIGGFLVDWKKSNGKLIIDETDPLKDIFTLEITDPIDIIYDKSSIKLKIERRMLDGEQR